MYYFFYLTLFFQDALRVEKKLSQDELFGKVKTGILRGFLELDEKLRKIPEVANGEDKSGTTAVCALVTEQVSVQKSSCNFPFANAALLNLSGGV